MLPSSSQRNGIAYYDNCCENIYERQFGYSIEAFVIHPNVAHVEALDSYYDIIVRNYNGLPQTVEYEITFDNPEITYNPENFFTLYVGAGYCSTEAPTKLGVYTVISMYEEYKDGVLYFILHAFVFSGLVVGINVVIHPINKNIPGIAQFFIIRTALTYQIIQRS